MNDDWRFMHAGAVVKDVKKAAAFYQGLGFAAGDLRELAIPAGELQVNGEPSTEVISLNICNVSRGDFTLELIEPVAGDFIHTQSLKSDGEGVNHLFFSVPDLPAAKAEMIAEGFPFVFGNEGFAFFDTRAVGNILIELAQKEG
jgi:catechol 2,3-dioxygenase-like lactoylglutathione lyase family enzyme